MILPQGSSKSLVLIDVIFLQISLAAVTAGGIDQLYLNLEGKFTWKKRETFKSSKSEHYQNNQCQTSASRGKPRDTPTPRAPGIWCDNGIIQD